MRASAPRRANCGDGLHSMIVGTAEIRLALRDARSLKDKRSVVSSLKDRLHRKFNVSVAEVDCQDTIQAAVLGIALASNESRHANSALDKVVQDVRRCPAAELVDYRIEIF